MTDAVKTNIYHSYSEVASTISLFLNASLCLCLVLAFSYMLYFYIPKGEELTGSSLMFPISLGQNKITRGHNTVKIMVD